MTTSQNKTGEKPDEAAEIKRKLAKRMVIAGLMILGLLGGLALFDRSSAPSRMEAEMPQFTEPVPVQKKMATQPVTPVETVAEAVQASQPAEPEISKSPANISAPLPATPPPPVVAAQPSLPRVGHAAGKATEPAPDKPAAGQASTRASAPMREDSPALPAVTISPAPVSAPAPAPARLMSGYALQAGVFSDTQHAEELLSRLQLAGIPASIEARVQVGPFKSRAEADSARRKLNSLGIESVLLPLRKAAR